MRLLSVACALILAAASMPQTVSAGTVYAIDGENNEIVTLEMATGMEQLRFLTPEPSSGGPDGLAVTGSAMFFINANGSNMVYHLDPDTGTVTGTSPVPELLGGSDGLAAMEDTLFSLEPFSDTISRVRISTGETLGSCVTGLGVGGGLAAEAGRLFVTVGLASVVELQPETCLVIGGPFALPGNDLAYGLAFDGEYLYAGSIIQRGIHTLDPDTGGSLGFLPLEYSPTGLAATSEVAVELCDLRVDIRPDSQANILNTRSRGRMPVALYGTMDMDIGSVAQDSLELAEVPVDHAAFEDVDGDGILDLIMHFRTQALVASLETDHGELQDGAVLDMTLSAFLIDGAGCSGVDSVRIRAGETDHGRDPGTRNNRRGRR